MDAIVAVYADWGIGAKGTQPIALSADRAYFRRITKGAAVIVGRKTVEDFPGGKPLPGRANLLLTRQAIVLPGFEIVHSPEEALERAAAFEQVFVIGGASVYKTLLPYCSRVFVTKLAVCPESDVFFPNLEENSQWKLTETLGAGEENGIAYEFLLFQRS